MHLNAEVHVHCLSSVLQLHPLSPNLTALGWELTNAYLPNLQVIDLHLGPKSVAAISDLEKDLCA